MLMPYLGEYLRCIEKSGRKAIFATPRITEAEQHDYDNLTLKASNDYPDEVQIDAAPVSAADLCHLCPPFLMRLTP